MTSQAVSTPTAEAVAVWPDRSRPADTSSRHMPPIRRLLSLAPHELDELKPLCAVAAQLFSTSAGGVHLIDDRHQHRVVAYGVDPAVCRREDSICQSVMTSGESLVLPDTLEAAWLADNPWVNGALGHVRFYAAAPLRLDVDGGVIVGTLSVFDSMPRPVTAGQRHALDLLALLASTLLTSILTTADLREREDMLSAQLTTERNRIGQLADRTVLPLSQARALLAHAVMAMDPLQPRVETQRAEIRNAMKFLGSAQISLGDVLHQT